MGALRAVLRCQLGLPPRQQPWSQNKTLCFTANQKPVVGTSQVSIMSSAERARRYVNARAAYELAEARVAMLAAAEDMAACSQSGSVGRRLDDVRSVTGSSGPSPPTRDTAKENPFEGIFSSPSTTTIPSDYL